MSAFATTVKFFQDCGLFIYPSLLIMSLGLAIAIDRLGRVVLRLRPRRRRQCNNDNWVEELHVSGKYYAAQ